MNSKLLKINQYLTEARKKQLGIDWRLRQSSTGIVTNRIVKQTLPCYATIRSDGQVSL